MTQTVYTHTVVNHIFITIACVCEGMEGGEGGRGRMTNSGQLKPLGLNTIVVAEENIIGNGFATVGVPVE